MKIKNSVESLIKILKNNAEDRGATELVTKLENIIAELSEVEEIDESALNELKEAIDSIKESLVNKEEVEEIVNNLNDKFELKLKNDIGNMRDINKQNTYLKSDKAVKDFMNSFKTASKNGKKVTEIWKEKLIENNITGLSFPTAVSEAIATKWTAGTGLLAATKRVSATPIKLQYTTQNQSDLHVRAKGHQKGKYKLPLKINLQPKQLNIGAIYADIPVYNVDMAAMGDSVDVFLEWVIEEGYNSLINEIERAIILGDGRSGGDDEDSEILDIEGIGSKTESDAWTLIKETTSASLREDVRALTDALITYPGKERWGYASASTITELAKYVYGEGGTVGFQDVDVLAKELGLDRLIEMEMPSTTKIVVITPEEYHRVGGEPFGERWDAYKENAKVYRSEIFMGGGIRGLLSTGKLVTA